MELSQTLVNLFHLAVGWWLIVRGSTGLKVAPSGVEAIFINYYEGHYSYKLWMLSEDKMMVTHHTVFFLDTFPLRMAKPLEPCEHLLVDFTVVKDLPTPCFEPLGLDPLANTNIKANSAPDNHPQTTPSLLESSPPLEASMPVKKGYY